MQTYELALQFRIGALSFTLVRISIERFLREIPLHCHADNCYEVHYIAAGRGTVYVQNKPYALCPGSLFVTGPNLEHAQSPDRNDPMEEYCLFIKCDRQRGDKRMTSCYDEFEQTSFWIGTDTQGFWPVLQNLLRETIQKRTGYQEACEAIFKQMLILLVRNYQNAHAPAQLPTPHITKAEQQYLLIDELFL